RRSGPATHPTPLDSGSGRILRLPARRRGVCRRSRSRNAARCARTAARFRSDAGCPPDLPLPVETLLPRLYPAAIVVIRGLSVTRCRDWLARRGADVPPGLQSCRDRRLHGAVIAWRGFGLLCVDAEDAGAELRFTVAHEAAHFPGDHRYPRQDL